jgi:hypothetical protein
MADFTESVPNFFGVRRLRKTVQKSWKPIATHIFIAKTRGADIRPNLFEHIDGLYSMWKKKPDVE